MDILKIENVSVLHSGSYLTEISAPEDVRLDLSKHVSKDFQSEVSGLLEHYVAVAKNYNDEDILNKAIEFFNQRESTPD